MRSDQRKLTVDALPKLLSVVIAICATWPLLAAEPIEPAAPKEQETPEELDAGSLRRTRFTPARYPQFARDRGMEAVVDLKFTILPDGSTSDIEIVQTESHDPLADRATQAVSNSLFEESAIEAVKQWRYEPVIRDGRPVLLSAATRIRFALEDGGAFCVEQRFARCFAWYQVCKFALFVDVTPLHAPTAPSDAATKAASGIGTGDLGPDQDSDTGTRRAVLVCGNAKLLAPQCWPIAANMPASRARGTRLCDDGPSSSSRRIRFVYNRCNTTTDRCFA